MDRALIAIIDDERVIVDLLDGLLNDEGYDTVCYYSGSTGYEAIKEHVPSLVILDMQMEHKEAGLNVLQRMRANTATRNIPVILYSADTAFLRQKAKYIQDNNCTILEKPFDLYRLLDHIHKYTGRALQPHEV
jgi:DNA-binding NtrC family response regulator